MTRCFVAFELSEASRAYLAAQVGPLHRRLSTEAGWPVRLVPAENWHCTLLFFPGLQAAERAVVWTVLASHAAAGAWRALRFDWEGPSLWPLPRRPTLLCIAASPYPEAAAWPIRQHLAAPPFDRARAPRLHRFRPHITVMRFRKGRPVNRSREWAAISRELPPLDGGRIRFDRVSLFLSTTSPGAPVYPREYSALL